MVDEIENLKAAIRWLMETGATCNSADGWSEGGCQCYASTPVTPPPEVAETLKEFA